jgi:hypothetical protein
MLDDMLHKLEKQGTPNIMLQTFNYMLSLTLNLPYDKVTSQWTHDSDSIPHVLLWAIKHQNLVGWDNFMKGFISTKWKMFTRNYLVSLYNIPALNGTHN